MEQGNLEVSLLLRSDADLESGAGIRGALLHVYEGAHLIFPASFEDEEGRVKPLIAFGLPVAHGNGVVGARVGGQPVDIGSDERRGARGIPVLRQIAVAQIVVVLIVERFEIGQCDGVFRVVGVRLQRRFVRLRLLAAARQTLDANIIDGNRATRSQCCYERELEAIVAGSLGSEGEGAGSIGIEDSHLSFSDIKGGSILLLRRFGIHHDLILSREGGRAAGGIEIEGDFAGLTLVQVHHRRIDLLISVGSGGVADGAQDVRTGVRPRSIVACPHTAEGELSYRPPSVGYGLATRKVGGFVEVLRNFKGVVALRGSSGGRPHGEHQGCKAPE